jgi:chloramphenicol O-acetyltransferase
VETFERTRISSNQQNTGASFFVFLLFKKTRILDVDWKFKLRRVEHMPEGNSDTAAAGT